MQNFNILNTNNLNCMFHVKHIRLTCNRRQFELCILLNCRCILETITTAQCAKSTQQTILQTF